MTRVEELREVVFQEKLGTSYEKMERFRALALYLARRVESDSLDEVKKVATLCKGDLVTQMVGEFADLQGVMGKEYALLEGEPQNLPSQLPQDLLGFAYRHPFVATPVDLAGQADNALSKLCLGKQRSHDSKPKTRSTVMVHPKSVPLILT